jgi:ABC-type glycerol-3-phosphate transport system substrate-binding protein
VKRFTIEVSHASPGQLQTIGLELKIMSNAWEKFGPRIKINGEKLQAPSLHEPRTKRQAASHNMARFI